MESQTAPAIELTDLALTRHACRRYAERVRPTLEGDAAARELARLIWEQGSVVAEPPQWLAERQRTDAADAYVVVGEDLVLPVRCGAGPGAQPAAVTCLDRTGVSARARAGRNRQRRARAARSRERRSGGTRPRRRR